ncbi:MAG: cation transporter [Actinobacteria bacterium]|nr:cation transporter [Actinomycetota bacterium]MBM3713493.1 cation transporter [Actinomycetota bacterium]
MEHSHPPKIKNKHEFKQDHEYKNIHNINTVKQPHDESKPHFHYQFRSYERKRLLIAIVLTAAMMVGEVAGGLISGSLALLSDAGHMLSHSFALLVSFLAILYACRPATAEKSFGFYRAEILAALFNGIILLIITGFIFWEAYKRIISPKPINEVEMFIIALAGLAVNIATALILWKASRESLNVRSAFIHMLGDTGSSVGVVIGAVIIYFTGFYIIDAIFSIIIAVLILVWAVLLIRDSVRILMESAPKNININELKQNLVSNIDKVKDIHDIHVWEITTGMYCMTAHILIEDMSISKSRMVLNDLSRFLAENYNILHPIIQFESGKGFSHEYICELNNFNKKNKNRKAGKNV